MMCLYMKEITNFGDLLGVPIYVLVDWSKRSNTALNNTIYNTIASGTNRQPFIEWFLSMMYPRDRPKYKLIIIPTLIKEIQNGYYIFSDYKGNILLWSNSKHIDECNIYKQHCSYLTTEPHIKFYMPEKEQILKKKNSRLYKCAFMELCKRAIPNKEQLSILANQYFE